MTKFCPEKTAWW